MKKDVQYEENFIFTIDRHRRHVKEIFLWGPLTLALLYFLIGAPVIIALCDVPVWSYPILPSGPLAVVSLVLFIRKRIIMTHFIKIKDISDKVELIELQLSDFEKYKDEEIFMFKNSDYMMKILYNWLYSIGIKGDGKLKIYKVFIDNYAPTYLSIRESDLIIPPESMEMFKQESRKMLHYSDLSPQGKAVNVNVYERVTRKS